MRRRIGFLFICSAVVPIAVFAATAWGCGTLVTMSSSPKVAAPNQLVTVTGRHWGATPTNTNVQIRWNSRTGPILREATPAEMLTGVLVAVPAGTAPGWYVLTGTQFNATTGVAKTGSPGRTTVRVQGASANSNTPWGAAKPTGSGGPGSPDVPVPAILLSVGLLATGLTLVARGRTKKATRPALGA